jgi:hypothetical protein
VPLSTDGPKLLVSLAIRSQLSANMKTARVLLNNHQAIMKEVAVVLDEVAKQLATLERDTLFRKQRSRAVTDQRKS